MVSVSISITFLIAFLCIIEKLNKHYFYTIQNFILCKGFLRSKKGKYCSKSKVGILKAFQINPLYNAYKARTHCEEFCHTNYDCWGCSVASKRYKKYKLFNAIPDCGAIVNWAGLIEGDITQKLGTIQVIHSSLFDLDDIILLTHTP